MYSYWTKKKTFLFLSLFLSFFPLILSLLYFILYSSNKRFSDLTQAVKFVPVPASTSSHSNKSNLQTSPWFPPGLSTVFPVILTVVIIVITHEIRKPGEKLTFKYYSIVPLPVTPLMPWCGDSDGTALSTILISN